MLEIKLTKIHKTVELSPNSIFKYTNLVGVIMLYERLGLSQNNLKMIDQKFFLIGAKMQVFS